MSLNNYSIKQLETMLHNNEISAKEIAELSFAQIDAVEADVKAFISLNKEASLQKAAELDEKKAYDGELAAIPGAIKDNIVTKGIATTAASNMLKNFSDPLYDATVTEKLTQSDALMIGKTNLDEFAMGSSTETSAFHKTANPWNLAHTPGGSSGGSAAAVAAGEVLFTLGSDTGGSIRQPAAFTGIVGMKPTYGLVSRYGLVAFAPSLDQIGPMTRTVEDNARVLEVIAGHDKKDSTSSQEAVPAYSESLDQPISGLKIAVPKEFLGEGIQAEVKAAVEAAVKTFESLGATVEEISLPTVTYADAIYAIIAYGEGSSSTARYDGVRYGLRADNATDMIDMFKQSRAQGFGDEAKRRILFGATMLSGAYNESHFRKAQKIRTIINNEIMNTFNNYDLIIGPATATTAFKLGEKQAPAAANLSDVLAIPANLAGVPALSLPCGFDDNGLPIGLQIIGKHFTELTIYQAAKAFEQVTDFHTKLPNVGGAN